MSFVQVTAIVMMPLMVMSAGFQNVDSSELMTSVGLLTLFTSISLTPNFQCAGWRVGWRWEGQLLLV